VIADCFAAMRPNKQGWYLRIQAVKADSISSNDFELSVTSRAARISELNPVFERHGSGSILLIKASISLDIDSPRKKVASSPSVIYRNHKGTALPDPSVQAKFTIGQWSTRRTGDALLFKNATAVFVFSSPRLGRAATISLVLVAGAGGHICEGTFERILL
jgi:hypothetical protein